MKRSSSCEKRERGRVQLPAFDSYEAILREIERRCLPIAFSCSACLLVAPKIYIFLPWVCSPPPSPSTNVSKNCKIGILRHPEPSLLAWPKFHSNLHLLQQKRTGHKGSFCTGLHRAKIGICEKTRESIGTFVTEEVFGI